MLTHNRISCAREGCYAVITLHPNDERRLRDTHETFYCPAGHTNFFPGKTETEKKIDRLEHQLEMWQKREDRAWGHFQVLHQALSRGAQVCPLGCGWRTTRRLPWGTTEDEASRFLDRVGGDLCEHLLRDHNATLKPIALLEAGSTDG